VDKAFFFSSVRSPHCFKLSIFLHEKAIDFERIEIDLVAKEQKTKEYLAINPLGQVPAFQDDQGIHIDSLDIMLYLDQRYPEPKLFPEAKNKRKEVLDWIECSSGPMRDVSHHLYWQLIEAPTEGTNWTEVKRLKEQAHQLLVLMEEALIRSEAYLCGAFSAADLSVFAWVYGYKRFDLPESWKDYPNLKAWFEKLEKRPSVKLSYQVEGKAFQDYLK